MPDVPSSVSSSNPQNNAIPSTDGVTEAKSVLDLLLAEQVISKQQYDEVKVKSATQGLKK